MNFLWLFIFDLCHWYLASGVGSEGNRGRFGTGVLEAILIGTILGVFVFLFCLCCSNGCKEKVSLNKTAIEESMFALSKD